MSVKIRLSLTGRSHQISYRLVAQDTHSKRDGRFLEILGFINPFQKDQASKIDKERIKYYISKGATFTPSAKFVFENGKLPPKPKKIKEPKAQEASKLAQGESNDKSQKAGRPSENLSETQLQTDPNQPDNAEKSEKPAEDNTQPL